jgi:mRNA-degrading endonuclease RelE of RelBE toxin-antitoxin system
MASAWNRDRAALDRSSAIQACGAIRIGDYRVVYAVKDAELVVLALRTAHRSDIYRNL